MATSLRWSFRATARKNLPEHRQRALLQLVIIGNRVRPGHGQFLPARMKGSVSVIGIVAETAVPRPGGNLTTRTAIERTATDLQTVTGKTVTKTGISRPIATRTGKIETGRLNVRRNAPRRRRGRERRIGIRRRRMTRKRGTETTRRRPQRKRKKKNPGKKKAKRRRQPTRKNPSQKMTRASLHQRKPRQNPKTRTTRVRLRRRPRPRRRKAPPRRLSRKRQKRKQSLQLRSPQRRRKRKQNRLPRKQPKKLPRRRQQRRQQQLPAAHRAAAAPPATANLAHRVIRARLPRPRQRPHLPRGSDEVLALSVGGVLSICCKVPLSALVKGCLRLLPGITVRHPGWDLVIPRAARGHFAMLRRWRSETKASHSWLLRWLATIGKRQSWDRRMDLCLVQSALQV
mmetsp:Transcript_91882/g.230953  ORF Transcript_91882/g.230953 Transcript_91882/m.230953 type:complete len:400 (-) Transcript_91882:129-1328(-)